MIYIVAGPIGNLKDITLRALETLKEVDLIACEDTRRTGKLLNHYNIKTPMESYNDYNKGHKLPELLKLLTGGGKVALFSDAGTPTISDPGFKLVEAAHKAGVAVSPIPGPSAAIGALCVSGQPTDKFIFVGFLPKQSGKRLKLLNSLKDCQLPSSAIFYESPYRLIRLLEELGNVFGKEVEISVCGELTKIHEKVTIGTMKGVLENFTGKEGKIKGEFTVVLNLKSCQK